MSIKKATKSHQEKKNHQSHEAWLLRKKENALQTSNKVREVAREWMTIRLEGEGKLTYSG